MTTPTTVQVKFQLRGDTAANWASVNPVLLNNELGLETDTKKLKVGNGSTAWNSLAYFPSIVTGGTVLGNLEIGTTGTLTFEGSTADGFETTLGVINPTADRTINLPNQSGTVVVSGNASIVDADIAADAEIAVSKLADGAARQLLQTDAAGTGVEWTSNIDIPGTLDVTGAATFDAAVTIAGDLTVNGTTTNINTTNLVVEDKNIILGDVATPTDITADGGGITLKGATDKTINWVDATDAWTSSEHIELASGKEYRINGTKVLDATSLGSAVVSSSLTSVGTIGTGVWQGTAIDAAYLDSTIVTTGDTGTVTSTMIADGTIVDGDVNASAAIAGTKISPNFGSQTVQTTGIFSHALGTAGAPTITFTGDPNTGLYSPGADQVAISTNGAQALYINADGDILVADGNRMEIDEIRARDGAGLKLFDDGGAGIFIEDGGKVGLGTSSPATELVVSATSNPVLRLNNSTNAITNLSNIGGFEVYTNDASTNGTGIKSFVRTIAGPFGAAQGSASLTFGTAALAAGDAVERVRIDEQGRVGIGVTTVGSPLHVKANSTEGIRIESPDFSSVYGLVTSRRNSNTPLEISAVHTVGTLDASISFSRSTNGTTFAESGRWDKDGRLLVGTSSALNSVRVGGGSGTAPQVQIQGTTAETAAFSITRTTGGAPQFSVNFGSSGTNAAINSTLGVYNFNGFDGFFYTTAAQISAAVDGTPGANDMPGRLVFATTADGASSPTERLRITSAGVLQVADAGNITVGTTTGTKIGTATTQKLGFYNATPVVQPAAVADATTAVDVITQLNDLLAKLRTLGIIAT